MHFSGATGGGCVFILTFHWAEAPFFSIIIASAGSTPQKMVLAPLGRALGVPLVVVLKGQSTGHALRISQQSMDICK